MAWCTKIFCLGLFAAVLCSAASVSAQENQVSSMATSVAASPVPRLIKFTGTLLDEQGRPMKSPVGVTFALYAQQSGSAALWMETQNIELDAGGDYMVLLGATSAHGVPAELFATGEARWLGVQAERQTEQPRVLLVSVPYALKAGDAQTLGGLPPSAFLQTPNNSSMVLLPTSVTAAATPAIVPAISTGAPVTTPTPAALVPGTVPLADGTSDIKNSQITDNGTTVAIGGCTPDPTSKLDVCGPATIGGTLQLPSKGKAIPGLTGGMNSQPFDLFSSTFSSKLAAAIPQHFRWQLEPVGQNTAAPGAKVSLLYAAGPAALVETGFSIDNHGLITFAKGQTLPVVTGNETVSGNFTAGGSISGASASFTGNVTTGAQTIKGNITDTGNISATGSLVGADLNLPKTVSPTVGVISLGGTPFLHNFGFNNTFVGTSAGNTSPNLTGVNNSAFGAGALRAHTTGQGNTGVGSFALANNTKGDANTAMGFSALFFNSLGSHNTAYGFAALTNSSEDINGNNNNWNTAIGDNSLALLQSGNLDTALGFHSGFTTDQSNITTGSDDMFLGPNTSLLTGTLNYATAIGANAEVDKSNAMVLGSINGVNGCTPPSCDDTLVGIGITKPTARLHIGNTGGTSFKNFLRIEGPTTQIGFPGFADVSLGGFGNFEIDAAGVEAGRFLVREDGLVGIGLSNNNPPPVRPLVIAFGYGHAVADGWDTYSSRRWKTNIHPLTDALEKVERLRGVSYDLKNSGKHEIGVIAEEVGEVVPEVVSYEKNGKDAQGVDYSRLTALLIEAVKAQQKQIATQRVQIRRQQQLASAQKHEIARLSRKIGMLETNLHSNHAEKQGSVVALK